MNFYRLKVLSLVCNLQSVSKAAEALHLTQPAVSSHLREAEKFFGCTLFTRSGHGLRMTPAGLAVQAYVNRVLAEMDHLRGTLADLQASPNPRLILGTSATIGNYVLPDLLGRFRAQNPQVEFTIHVLARNQVLAEVAAGRIELGYVLSDNQHPELVREHVASVEMVVTCAADHPLARQAAVTLADLANERMVMPLTGTPHREVVDQKLRGLGIRSPAIGAEFSTGEAMKRAVEAGLGIGLFSYYTVAREVAAGSLKVLAIEGMRMIHPLDLVYRPDKPFSPILAAFREFLRTHSPGSP